MGLITEWNAEMFNDMIYPLVQRKGMLADTVYTTYGFDQGQYKWTEQAGPVDFNTTTNRLGSTQWEEMDCYSRRITKVAYEKNLIFDKNEKLDRIVDPTRITNQQLAAGAARLRDDIIIAAAVGNAYQGKQSTSAVTLASYDSGSHVITESGTDGLTFAKIVKLKKLFMQANVDPMEQLNIVVSPEQWEDAMSILQITSSDYNSQRVLSQGAMGTFLGFNWYVSNALTLASNKRTCIAYASSGIEVAIASEFDFRFNPELPEHKHNMGLSAYLYMGATRREEAKVISFQCYEA